MWHLMIVTEVNQKLFITHNYKGSVKVCCNTLPNDQGVGLQLQVVGCVVGAAPGNK